jgi:hypothetical protein
VSYVRLYMDDERTRVSSTSRSPVSVPAAFLTVRLPRVSFFGSHSPAKAHPRVSALLRGSGLSAPRDVLDTSSLLSLLPPALCTLAGAHIGMTPHVYASTVATPSVAPIRAGRPGRAALTRSVGLGVEAPPLPPWPPALYIQLLVCFLIFFSLSQCSSRSSR